MTIEKREFGEGRYYSDGESNVVISGSAEGLLELIKRQLKTNSRVCIERFGCFEKRAMKGRKFYNNKVKRVTRQKPYIKVCFVPSTVFKRTINEQ